MQTNPPIYFKKLELENIRSFSQRQALHLLDSDGRPARWTLIVGDNGVGKTTLLQCLVHMCPKFNPPSNENDDTTSIPNEVEPELLGEESNEVLDALIRSAKNVNAHLEAAFSLGASLDGKQSQTEGSIETCLELTRSDGVFEKVKGRGAIQQNTEKPEAPEEPLILGYGAGRYPMTNTDEKKTVSKDPTGSLFRAVSPLHDAQEFLYTLEFAVLKKKEKAEKLRDNLKAMLAEILPDIDQPEDIEILGPPTPVDSTDTAGVQVKTSSGKVPFDQLSLGHQTVFAWTMDIARRLFERYPDSNNPLQESAIVIVDEIDLHLHPRWQRDIRELLTGHFPNIQFITTAHSPLMAQISLGTNLVVLQKSEDHTEINNDPDVIHSWRLDQVITSDLFGFETARPPAVEKLLERRRVLAEKEERSEAENTALEELDRQVEELPTEESHADQRVMDIIRRAAKAFNTDGRVS